jgi:hypothetical protein
VIFVARPAEVPLVLLNEGASKTENDCAAYDAGQRSFKTDSAIYGDGAVKHALVDMFHGKCCYCESYVRHISPGNIDHFRPAGASQQAVGEPINRPGYYWLAYAWDNLLFTCNTCNQYWKRFLFPLENQEQRARTHHDPLHIEAPLLIDPSSVNPADYVGYHDEIAYAVADNIRGVTTIAAIGLNLRGDLVEYRARRLATLRILRRVVQLLPGTPEAADAQVLLDHAESDFGEYSGMWRAAI